MNYVINVAVPALLGAAIVMIPFIVWLARSGIKAHGDGGP